jgi:hypothetical protein
MLGVRIRVGRKPLKATNNSHILYLVFCRLYGIFQYVKRRPSRTEPQTYTAGEVARILKGEVTEIMLERWDKSGIFRPSFYYDRRSAGGLISASQRDAFIESRGTKSRGDPKRRYTYQELIWLRLIIYVKNHFERTGIPNPSRRSAEIVERIRRITQGPCPPASRLVFIGSRDVYFFDERGIAEHLSDDRQLAMRTLLTDSVFAEVEGRIAVLEATDDIRPFRATGNGET